MLRGNAAKYLIGCSLAVSTTASTFASEATWSHNGSTVRVVSEGNQRSITYVQPRPGMIMAGAKPGDVVFTGTSVRGRVTGTAYLFSKRCGHVSFPASGTESSTGFEIVLAGDFPKLSTNCQVIATTFDTLIFEKNVQGDVPPFRPPNTSPPAPQQPLPESHQQRSGTGFFVSANGLVMTNAHVVDGCTTVAISSAGGLKPVRVVADDATNDLALLESGIAPAKFAALRSGVRLGESVGAFGYPLSGLLATSGNFTLGNITALVGLKDDTRYFQISAPVQPGNSGGPLLDKSGNLIGIVSAKLNALRVMVATNGDIPQNVNFAIKASVAATFMDSHEVAFKADAAPNPAADPAELAEAAKAMSVFVKCN